MLNNVYRMYDASLFKSNATHTLLQYLEPHEKKKTNPILAWLQEIRYVCSGNNGKHMAVTT